MKRSLPFSLRRTLRLVHLWVGVVLCAPLILLGVTGSMLVAADSFRHNAPSAISVPSYGAVLDATRAVAPAGKMPATILPPRAADGAVEVRFAERQQGAQPGPGISRVLVDPQSLAILATGASDPDFWRNVQSLHANLMNGRAGRDVVGWFGVALAALCLSGIVLWWPRGRWGAALTVQRGARGARLLRELHGAVGIWSVAIFLAVIVTGVYLVFPQTVGGLVPGADPAKPPPRVAAQAGAIPLDADGALALATGAVSNARLRFLGLPTRPDQPFRILLSRVGDESFPVTVFVDPWAKRVAEIRDPRAMPAGQRVLVWMHPLHEGAGLGPVWQVLVFLTGLLPPFFAITGIAMWLMKRGRRRGAAGKVPVLGDGGRRQGVGS